MPRLSDGAPHLFQFAVGQPVELRQRPGQFERLRQGQRPELFERQHPVRRVGEGETVRARDEQPALPGCGTQRGENAGERLVSNLPRAGRGVGEVVFEVVQYQQHGQRRKDVPAQRGDPLGPRQ